MKDCVDMTKEIVNNRRLGDTEPINAKFVLLFKFTWKFVVVSFNANIFFLRVYMLFRSLAAGIIQKKNTECCYYMLT